MPDFFMLCGLPYSGKTYVRKRLELLLDKPVVISMEDWILKVAAAQGTSYDNVFKDYSGFALDHSMSLLIEAVREQRPVIIDMTHLTVEARAASLAHANKHYRKYLVICEASETIRKIRIKERTEQVVPSEVLRTMERDWQPPTLKEGFHAILYDREILNARAA